MDFAISEDNKFERIIEVKLSDDQVSKNLIYFTKKYNLIGQQIVKNIKQGKNISGIGVVNSENFLEYFSFIYFIF